MGKRGSLANTMTVMATIGWVGPSAGLNPYTTTNPLPFASTSQCRAQQLLRYDIADAGAVFALRGA